MYVVSVPCIRIAIKRPMLCIINEIRLQKRIDVIYDYLTEGNINVDDCFRKASITSP